jgi:carbonic anhydrase
MVKKTLKNTRHHEGRHIKGKQTLKVTFFLLVTLLLAAQVSNMKIRCNPRKIKSPINLDMPLPFEKFEPSLHFVKPDKPITFERLSPNTFEMVGDFGFIHFNGNTREVKQVLFKSPSEHTVQGVQFPMEM